MDGILWLENAYSSLIGLLEQKQARDGDKAGR